MNTMTPLLIGYFPRHTTPAPAGLAVHGVEEFANLGHYGSGGPKNWVDQWLHNEMWLYDSEEIAREVIANALEIHITPEPNRDPPWLVNLTREKGSAFDFYAYKLYLVRFTDGNEESFDAPPVNAVPLPDDYQLLGYDAVNKTCCAEFECSPLFCNGMCDEIKVNRHCLLDTLERGLEVARYFSVRKPEPGTYHVIEVWRKTTTGKPPVQRKDA